MIKYIHDKSNNSDYDKVPEYTNDKTNSKSGEKYTKSNIRPMQQQ